MVRSARDAALVLQAVAGHDPRDPYSRDVPVPDFSARLGEGVRGVRAALCPDLYDNAEVDGEVVRAFEGAVDVFRRLGAAVETSPLPEGNRFIGVHRTIIGAEFLEVHRPLYEKNPAGYGEETRKRIEERLGSESVDEYIRAQRERELLRRTMLGLFREVDIVLTPALPCIAPPIDGLKAVINGKEEVYSLAITMPFLTPQNLTGCPSVVVPMGFSEEGMPLSLQIVGRPWEEAEVLRAAHAYERATPEIRGRRPPV